MMPSTSRSNRGKPKKFKFIPKPKQQWQVKQPTRNWLELPEDLMANILYRVGVFDILENAQKVCTAWRKICKDPAMWRVIYLDRIEAPNDRPPCRAMCMHAVDRSQGQLIDITMVNFCDDDLLLYIADRSSQLRRLKIDCSYGDIYEGWIEALKKFPLLEELDLYTTEISKEGIETAGRYCPMLKTLKVTQEAQRHSWVGATDMESIMIQNETAVAIGENLHELEHLDLTGDIMSNIGLQTILDGCRHLKSLDLSKCLYIDLKGDLGKRCSEQINCLKLPGDSHEGCSHTYENDCMRCHVTTETDLLSYESDDDYYEYSDYDDYTAYDFDNDDFPDFEDLNDMLTFMAMFD